MGGGGENMGGGVLEKIREKMGKEGVWLGRGENGGGGVFSPGPPFKRKKFSPQFEEKTREKSGEGVGLM